MAPRPAPGPVGLTRLTLVGRLRLVSLRYAGGSAAAHEYGSRPHIQAGGSRPESLARSLRAATDLPPTGAPKRPSYRDRSPIFPVLFQFLHEIAEGHNRLARRRAAAGGHGRGQPTRTHCFGQQGIREQWAAARLRRTDFRYDAVTIGNEHSLATGSKADVFAELVLEHFEANRTHTEHSSYQKLLLSTAQRAPMMTRAAEVTVE